ncbi:MAG TPA: hypothetical protein VIT90_06670 [Lysobacter sp.]
MADLDPDDPVVKLVLQGLKERVERADAHEELRASPEYREILARTNRSVAGLLRTLHLCDLAASQWTEYSNEYLFPRHQDDIGEAILVAQLAIENGGLNAARRELRHALEVAVNTLYVDEAAAAEDLDGKVKFFRGKKVNKANADHIRDLRLRMLGEDREAFVLVTHQAWVDASNYVHLTKRRMDEKLRLRAEGVRLGLETPAMLASVADELHLVCCIVVILAFEGIGPSLTADILVGWLDADDTWPFHDNPFIAAVDSHFDYKHERQATLAEHALRRSKRISSGGRD